MPHWKEANPADGHRRTAATVPERRPDGARARLMRLLDRPWASGLASFLTTVIMLLPVEYEVPLRGAMLFLTVRGR